MKKLTALFLAVVMMMALATSASAVMTETGTIKINNAAVGATYKLYRVFDLESVNSDKNVYVRSNKWREYINNTYFTVNDGYVTATDAFDTDTEAAVFATEIKTYADGNSIAADAEITATSSTVTFSGMQYGYYVVVTDRGNEYSAGTLNKDTLALNEKNYSLPYINKKVEEDDGNTWGDSNVAAIGENVNFEIQIVAGQNGKKYVVEDTLGAGFTFNNDTVITYNSTKLTENADYTVSVNEQKITFDLTKYCESCNLVANEEFLIKYSAKLDDDAVNGGNGNKNDVKLAYQDVTLENTAKKDSTTTYTYQITVNKVDENEAALTGAGFTLKMGDTVVKTIEDTSLSEFVFKGLDTGNYTIVESIVPAGYMKADDENVEITNENVTVDVVNTAGQALPETGGMGTTALYIAGAVLMLGAVAVLAGKKKVFEK